MNDDHYADYYALALEEGMSPEEAHLWAEAQSGVGVPISAGKGGNPEMEGSVSLSISPFSPLSGGESHARAREAVSATLAPASALPPALVQEPAYKSLGAQIMKARSMPPMEWIIPGLLPVGATLFAGREKVGKSFISLDLSYAVASGGRAMGSIRCPRGRVLYLALEDHVQRIDERLKMLEPDESDWPLEALSLVTAHEAENVAYLQPVMNQWLTDGDNPKLVILDTLNAYRSVMASTPRGKELSRLSVTQAETALLRPLQVWAITNRVSVLVIHHTNKAAAQDGDDAFSGVSGSRALTAAMDQTMVLVGQRGVPDAELVITGRDIPDSVYNLHRTGPWWMVTDALRDPKLGDKTNDVIAFVVAAPAPVRPKDVADALNLDNKYVGDLLADQIGRRVAKVARGLYWKLES